MKTTWLLYFNKGLLIFWSSSVGYESDIERTMFTFISELRSKGRKVNLSAGHVQRADYCHHFH